MTKKYLVALALMITGVTGNVYCMYNRFMSQQEIDQRMADAQVNQTQNPRSQTFGLGSVIQSPSRIVDYGRPLREPRKKSYIYSPYLNYSDTDMNDQEN